MDEDETSHTSPSHLSPTSASATTPKGGSIAAVVPLRKCASAPIARAPSSLGGSSRRSIDTDSVAAESTDSYWPTEEGESDEGEWKCRGCEATDARLLQPSADSAVSCMRCGTVEEACKMVSLTRQKNCALDDDKTVTADLPVDADKLELNAWADGVEAPGQRRRRLIAASGGSVMSVHALKKGGFAAAQSALERDTMQGLSQLLEGNGAESKKRRAVMRVLDAIFDSCGRVDPRLSKHVRIESNRILNVSLEHEGVCSSPGCQLALTKRSNALVALCLSQQIVESLVHMTVEDKPTDLRAITTPTLTKMLCAIKALQLSNAGATQRMQCGSAVSIVAGWNGSEHLYECEPAQAAAPPALRMPTALTGQDEAFGRPVARDPTDKTFKLRDRILAAAALINTHAEARDYCLQSLADAKMCDFLASATLPTDVLAVALLSAVAEHMNKPDHTPRIATTIARMHDVADSQVGKFARSLRSVLETMPPPENVYGLGEMEADMLF